MANALKVLFLTPWYPSEKDAMSGLFVQKHAEAVRAQGCEVRVIHSEGWRDLLLAWRDLRREGWMPDVVQLNVIQKQGVLALWLKRRYGIPYVIVEHWSGYLPENGMFGRFPTFKQWWMRRVCREAEMVLTVSKILQEEMQSCGFKARRWGTIDNVVDDFFFDKSTYRNIDISNRPKRFLHVSCFDERAKNVKGLLRAAKMLSERRQDWQLVMVGTGIDYEEIRAYERDLEIPEGLIRWTGELTPREVADEMHQADVFVLSSRYETYGVVLAEAAVAGMKIVSTPVGIAEEAGALIVPQEIAQNKAGKFAEFLEAALWKPSEVRSQYSAEEIGKKLKEVYDSCLHRDI